jgi:hypothetical protein
MFFPAGAGLYRNQMIFLKTIPMQAPGKIHYYLIRPYPLPHITPERQNKWVYVTAG